MPAIARTLATLVLAATVPMHADPLKIKTDHGKVHGSLTPDTQVRAFLGIPYAAPPIGPLRWQPPQPAAPWKGTRETTSFGPHCYQTSSFADMAFHDPGPSEDCLTLNIWTPANVKPGAKLPVMVWIYGGGFAGGSTSELRQDGQYLAHRNVIIVSMNYRLGLFGFFVHPALTAESPHHASGNYGLLDQAAALAWVHSNIRSFGGDPANITLFGESAGSISVSAHMASPLSRTLIAKAIGESGGAFTTSVPRTLPRQQRETQDTAFALAAYNTDSLPALRALTPAQLLEPITSGAHRGSFGADVDGYFLPQSVESIYAAGQQAHIPLLAGWNANESLAPRNTTAATFTQTATTDFAAQAPAFLAVYPATSDAEALASANDYAADRFIAFSTWRWIEAQLKTGQSPIYRYHFELPTPGDRFHPAASGAYHSDDIEYVFNTLDSRLDFTPRPEDRQLANQIATYWTTFARTGNPNTPGQPNWPTYHAPDYQVMHLNRASASSPDTHRDRYLFLDTFYATPLTPALTPPPAPATPPRSEPHPQAHPPASPQ